MQKQRLILASAAALSLMTSSILLADAQAAKDYIKQAQDAVESHDNDTANSKLELAEAELDGVDASTKASLTEQIKSIRATVASATASLDAAKYKRKLDMAMTEAESSVGNQVTWPGAASEVKELFNDPAAQASIPTELAAAKKKFATFEKISSKKLGAAMAEQVANSIKDLDAKWAESKPKFTDPNASPGDKSSAIDDMTRAMDDTRQQIAKLPTDDPNVTKYTTHLDAVGSEFTAIALADKAKDVLARLKENFDSYKDEYDGWQTETAGGPSWQEYTHNQNDKIAAFNAPKSKALVSRSDYFLKNLETNDDYKQVASAADMKAFIDGLKANRDKAAAQLLANAKPLVASAVAAGGEDLSKLKDDVRSAFGEDSPEGKSMMDALQGKMDSTAAAAAGAAGANAEWYKKMSEAASAAWPDISSKFSAEEGFDPSSPGDFKGKTIKITTDNLMGYRFKPGDFAFATTLNGKPVAAKFDPSLAAAIKAVEAKLGRSLGDDDNDGKWEIYAVVTGSTGQMMQKKQAEGDVTLNGEKVGTVTADYADPVTAPIITIVAAKCGPFAGGKGAGIVQMDGSVK